LRVFYASEEDAAVVCVEVRILTRILFDGKKGGNDEIRERRQERKVTKRIEGESKPNTTGLSLV
jgi:hypothetical protein